MKFLTCSLFLIVLSTTWSLSIFKDKKKDDITNDVKNPVKKIKFDQKTKYNDSSFTPEASKFSSFEKVDVCPKEAKCVPPIQCPAHLRMSKHPQLCHLPGGSAHGLCCTTGANHTTKDFFKKHSKTRSSDHHFMENVIHEAHHEFKTMMHQEMSHKISGRARDSSIIEPDFFHQMVFGNRHPQDALAVSSLLNSGVEQMMAARIFKEKEQLTIEEAQLNNFDAHLSGSPLEKTCPLRPSCPAKFPRYRTYDGTCNHEQGKETWGAAKTPMERLLPPAYEDGIWSPRVSAHDGSKLQSARTISRNLFPDLDRPHSHLNLMLMQFGQFLSHDFTQSSSITLPDGQRIKCCASDGSSILPPHQSHFACMPIFIDQDDEFYRKFNQRCMNFVRLAIAPDHNCRLGYAKTLSKVTHYIDGSAIYGSDMKTSSELRSFHHGKLRMFIDFNRELLPLDPKSDDCIMHGSACFMAGDVRVNQHIMLVAIHLLFAREHNRIAELLHHLNPHWSDDIIFEETRRIVVAEIQHITYNEWLPLVIGPGTMERFSLFSSPKGYSSDYNDDINPSMTNEFTGAAFRFGHSSVQGRLFVEFQHKLEEILLISDTFNNPGRFRFQHFYDEIIRTLVHEPMQAVDNSVTFGLSRFLFRGGNPFGLDLVSLNIQRGRDEALRPYNDYLDVAGNKIISHFDDFGPVIGPRLAQFYKSPMDIDLFVGGLIESADGEAVVGPTFREIIADQFSRLRRGDRYFYEHHPEVNPGHFNERQLEEIKKISLARIICDNSDKIALFTQSPNAFIQSNLEGNEPISCASNEILGIDLSAWKD